MKKFFTKLSFLALALVCFASNANSQNLFVETPIYYGSFESNTALWYSATTASNGITIASSTEKFVNGQRSAKISAADCSIYTEGMAGNVSVILGGSTTAELQAGNINNVAAGDYTFKVKVFIADKAPSQVFVYFAESNATITAGNFITIPLTGVTVGSWQTIQGTVTLNAYTAMKSSIRVRHQDYAGLTGASNVYFDNMELNVGGASAVSTLNAPKFTVFAANAKAVITTEVMGNVQILNIAGQVVKTIESVNGKTEFSTSEFSKGLYLAKVSSNGYSASKKFIVQ